MHFIHVRECLHVSKNHVPHFFLDNYIQRKTKKLLHTFVDIAKETACEKNKRKEAVLELELLQVFVSLSKRPDFWKSLPKIIYTIFHCRASITSLEENLCLYQKFILGLTYTIIIAPECFLIFWFCNKGNQVYYTWISYTPVLLVSIQLLFSHCVKYAEIRTFSDPYFPVFVQNPIRIFPYLDRISIYGKIGIRKPVFHHISRSVLLNIFSFNLDLLENTFCQCAKIIFSWIYELFNCAKIRGAQNLMGFRYINPYWIFATHE